MGQLRLQKVPMKRFDAGNLRSLASPELSRIFHDPELLPRGLGKLVYSQLEGAPPCGSIEPRGPQIGPSIGSADAFCGSRRSTAFATRPRSNTRSISSSESERVSLYSNRLPRCTHGRKHKRDMSVHSSKIWSMRCERQTEQVFAHFHPHRRCCFPRQFSWPADQSISCRVIV
jgi:hypothetical protein